MSNAQYSVYLSRTLIVFGNSIKHFSILFIFNSTFNTYDKIMILKLVEYIRIFINFLLFIRIFFVFQSFYLGN